MAGAFEGLPAARLLSAPDPSAVLARAQALCAYDGVIVTAGARASSGVAPELARMRALLFAQGFLPAAQAPAGEDSMGYLRSALVEDAGLVGVSGDDAVSMTDLGHRGRFGNQLFQYAFLKLYGLRNHATVQVPPWDGERLFGLKDARAEINRYPDIVFDGLEDDDLVLWEQDAPPLNVNFSGYFQEWPHPFLAHRHYLRRLLSLRPDWQAQLQALRDAACPPGRTLVAVHARRGDFLDGEIAQFSPIPLDWYLDFLREIWPGLAAPILHVATDGGAAVTEYFRHYPCLDLPPPPEGMPDFLPDFFLMRSAPVLAIANSSFSRMAALLAPDTQRCFLPSRADKRFVPYRPWEDRGFWRRFLPDGADSEAAKLSRLRKTAVALRTELGRLRHKAPGGALTQTTDAADLPCKACGAPAVLFAACDFENWGARTRSLCGKAVYYRRCGDCGLVFTAMFDGWSGSALQQSVYNDGFFAADPDFVLTRPAARARRLAALFPARAALSVLDFGAVNHATVETLKAEGFADAERFDYFDSTQRADGPADIVSCFDLLERTPEPHEMAGDLAKRLKPRGVIVYTAAMMPPGASDAATAGLAPRAGQVALYSDAALARLWSRLGFESVRLEGEWHMAFQALPDFAAHLVRP